MTLADDQPKFSRSIFLFVIFAGLALGAWLILIEFGMAFNTTPGDRVIHLMTAGLLWLLNPVGMIGWFMHSKRLIEPDIGTWIYLIGLVFSSFGWGWLWCFLRRNCSGKHKRITRRRRR
jgi:hypothetical protein